MPKVYRSMRASGEFPEVGRSAACLGVRPVDIAVDQAVDQAGGVHPNNGGMSVAPSWRSLPVWRIPERLNAIIPKARGNNGLHCWRMGEGLFEDGEVGHKLQLRVNEPQHGMIEPAEQMTLVDYEVQLAATRMMWTIDEA